MRLIGSKRTLAQINIDGVISDIGFSGSSTREVKFQLEAATKKGAMGLVLRINSPGGTVAACQEIFECISRKRKEGIPIVASMGDVAASGGLYVALAADEIYASPGTITGSIGVIIKSTDLSGLYNKIGVAPKVVKSGPFKDSLSSYRSLSAEERELLQGLITDTHNQFVEAISLRRSRPRIEIEAIADGRIMTGKQAHEFGIVDHLGDLETAVDRAGLLAGIRGKPKVIHMIRRRGLVKRIFHTSFSGQGVLYGSGLNGIPLWIMPNAF